MPKTILCFLLALCLINCSLIVSGQGKGPVLRTVNLDSLNADDKALLLLYKDSFDQDVQDFMFVIADSKKVKVDTTVYNMDKSSHVEIGLDFASRILSNGRDVGITGVFFSPSIAYLHKTGLYFALSMGFYTDKVISRQSAVPLVVLAAGFQRTFFRRWNFSFGYSRSITTYGLPLFTRSLLVHNFSVLNSVDVWKHIIIGAGIYFNWSTIKISRVAVLSFESHAIEIALSLRKEFIIYKFIGAKVFTITPAITAYFGNDNQAIVTQQRGSASGDSTITKKGEKYAANIKSFFGALDVEPSVSIDWRIGNLDIFAMPVLAIPFNTLNIDNGIRTANPKQYRFYVQAGVKYLFHVKKHKQGK